MKHSLLGLAVAASFVAATEAQALSITNRETTPQTLTVMAGDNKDVVTIDPEQAVEGICNAGCVIQLKNGDEYEFEGTEIVSMEDGALFLDDAGPAPAEQGSTDRPVNQ
jgi:hypothetical protein